jgi:hypothetical protein
MRKFRKLEGAGEYLFDNKAIIKAKNKAKNRATTGQGQGHH